MSASVIGSLQQWLASQCDGDWEHGDGITIETLDNPGWLIDISLAGTLLETVPFPERKENYEDPLDWMLCRKKDGSFQGACGPLRLEDMITIFLQWADSEGAR